MSEKDITQAIVAALLFHEDIGIAAQADYRTSDGKASVFPGASNIVTVSEGARQLIAEAWRVAEKHVEPVAPSYYGTCHYDIDEWV